VKAYREHCFWIAKGMHMLRPTGPAILSLTFCPPDKRRRDDDNCISSFKAGRDGIAEALGIDDSQLSLLVKMGQPVKGGAVLVEIMDRATV
jgi:crossover junction endodeoxyribonuclease RusA